MPPSALLRATKAAAAPGGRDGVAHRDAEAGSGQHLDVAHVVADRGDRLGLDARQLGHLRERGPFPGFGREELEDLPLVVLVLDHVGVHARAERDPGALAQRRERLRVRHQAGHDHVLAREVREVLDHAAVGAVVAQVLALEGMGLLGALRQEIGRLGVGVDVDERRADAAREREHLRNHLRRQIAMVQRAPAREILHERAVVHDDRPREPQLAGDRERGAEAPAGAEHHLEARVLRCGHRLARGIRERAVGIEQRPVDVESQQARAHQGPSPECEARRSSSSSRVRGQSFLSRRESARSASSRPCVWQGAQ